MSDVATAQEPQRSNLPALAGPRLPYYKGIQERYGVNISEWKVLCEAIFPSAQSVESIGMALAYCKSRKLDIFKRPIHIVPMWSRTGGPDGRGGMTETIWPGIAELRTTAFRTGDYAGCDAVIFGPDKTKTFKGELEEWVGKSPNRQKKLTPKEITLTFPEWGQVTMYRFVKGQKVAFVGPKVYWLEVYSTLKGTDLPNDRWERATRGQFEKVVEAFGLRKAFPEEIGSEYAAEEMEGKVIDGGAITPAQAAPVTAPPLDQMARHVQGAAEPSRDAAPVGAAQAEAASHEDIVDVEVEDDQTPAQQGEPSGVLSAAETDAFLDKLHTDFAAAKSAEEVQAVWANVDVNIFPSDRDAEEALGAYRLARDRFDPEGV